MIFIMGVFLLCMSASNQAYSAVSFQLGGGLDKAQLITSEQQNQKLNLKGAVKSAGAHIQPIQTLPIALGVVASQHVLTGQDQMESINLASKEFGVEACTWAKAGYVGFFLRGGKMLSGETTLRRGGLTSETWRHTDFHGSFGVAGGVAPSLSLMLEYRLAFGSSFEFLYGDTRNESPKYLQSSSVIFGFEFGV